VTTVKFAALLTSASVTWCISIIIIIIIIITKYPYRHKYVTNNKQFWATFPWWDIFTDISVTFSEITDISLRAVKIQAYIPGFPDKWPPITNNKQTALKPNH